MLVKPKILGPAQFAIDRFGIKGVGLPHLKLVDGRAGGVVAADEPGLFLGPGVRLLGRPALPRPGIPPEGKNRDEQQGLGADQRSQRKPPVVMSFLAGYPDHWCSVVRHVFVLNTPSPGLRPAYPPKTGARVENMLASAHEHL